MATAFIALVWDYANIFLSRSRSSKELPHSNLSESFENCPAKGGASVGDIRDNLNGYRSAALRHRSSSMGKFNQPPNCGHRMSDRLLRPSARNNGATLLLLSNKKKLSMTQKSTTQIAALLSQAGEAHHEYEQNQLGGEYDQNWPTWYADYIIKQGLGNLLNREVSTEQLGQFLSQSNEEYKKENPSQSWADYTAGKLLADFS